MFECVRDLRCKTRLWIYWKRRVILGMPPSPAFIWNQPCCKLWTPTFKVQGVMTCQLSLHHWCTVYGLKTRRDVGWPPRGQGRESQAGDVLALSMVEALYLPGSSSQTFQTKLNIFSEVQGPLDSWGPRDRAFLNAKNRKP